MSITSRMSEARREKLTNLKKREELKDALADKFKVRFGSGSQYKQSDEMSVASSHIRREVHGFAKGGAAITESNLNRLERRLQCKAKGPSKPNGMGSASSVVSGYSLGSRRSRSLASLGASRMSEGELEPQDWSRLDDYAGYLHEQDAVRQKMGVHALQTKLKMDLDNQCEEKKTRSKGNDEDDARYHQNQLIELERWKATEQHRAEELRHKMMKEKADRDEQLKFERKLKSQEIDQKKNEETQLVSKIVNEMEQEQNKFERKKLQTKAAMRAVFEENAEDTRIRDEQRQAKMAAEAEAMRENQRLMDEQEEARAEELAARMDRQKKLMENLLATTMESAKDAGDLDAQRANAQQAEMDSHFFQAEKTKMGRLKQMRLENQNYLCRQMGEKDGRREDERTLSNIQCQIQTKDTDEYNEIERHKAVDTRLRNFDHRQELEKQIAAKAGVRPPDMSKHETALNKPLLKLVHRTLKVRDEEVENMQLNAIEEEGSDC